jgi:hypothetical protein
VTVRHFTIAVALLLSCTAAPAVVPSPSVTMTASATPVPSSTALATASPSPKPLDMVVTAAGAIRGDHALVLQTSTQPGIGVAAYRFWDVPVDGSAPKLLVAYNRGDRQLTDSDYFDFARQLSPDGRQLVLTDPLDIAGTGLVVIDLVAGTTRKIDTVSAAGNATWSPDGRSIAYRGFTLAGPLQKESGIWVVSASGGLPRQVWTSDQAAGGNLTTIYGWTEDGRGIAFTRDRTEVSVLDIATQQVSHVAGAIYGITWRAERPAVALVVQDPFTAPTPSPRGAPGSIGQPGHVEVRDTTLGASRTVYRYGDVGTQLWEPHWNPATDEVLMYWVCGEGAGGRDEFVIIDAVRATSRTQPSPSCVRSVAWSGDGTRILYLVLGQGIRVRNADGSNDRELFRPALPPGASEQYVAAVAAFAPR